MILHDSVIISEGDFDRIRNIGKTLAQMKNQDTIPILIDCSDRERELGGRSPSDYPALDPLLHFGDDAIPFLLKKYDDADSAKKCRIGSILSMMRSPKASQTLKKLLGAEKDLNVRKCLIASSEPIPGHLPARRTRPRLDSAITSNRILSNPSADGIILSKR